MILFLRLAARLIIIAVGNPAELRSVYRGQRQEIPQLALDRLNVAISLLVQVLAVNFPLMMIFLNYLSGRGWWRRQQLYEGQRSRLLIRIVDHVSDVIKAFLCKNILRLLLLLLVFID